MKVDQISLTHGGGHHVHAHGGGDHGDGHDAHGVHGGVPCNKKHLFMKILFSNLILHFPLKTQILKNNLQG